LLVVGTYFCFIFLVYCSDFLRVGFAAHYYSWRFMQQFLGLSGLLVFVLIIIYLPETYHPKKRGVDNIDPNLLPKWRPVILNPLKPLGLLRSPNLLIVVRIFFFCHFKN
jgi:predicted MFS family arabinose efflux permease